MYDPQNLAIGFSLIALWRVVPGCFIAERSCLYEAKHFSSIPSGCPDPVGHGGRPAVAGHGNGLVSLGYLADGDRCLSNPAGDA